MRTWASKVGILPKPHVLAFYACFFFFGVATFAQEGMATRLGRHWKLLLPASAVLLVAGLATMNDRPLATVLQPAYAWTMSLGLVGLFCRLFPHPAPRCRGWRMPRIGCISSTCRW